MNKLIENKKNGKKSIGALSHLRSITSVEALGQAGLDYVMVDMEHSPLDTENASALLTAAKSVGMGNLVRIPNGERVNILHALDIGADAICIPDIRTVEECRSLVNLAKFKPVGNRGFCLTRGSAWGFSNEYTDRVSGFMKWANENSLLLPQCETVGCLNNIDEIMAIDGIDGFFFGPFDLSIDMGIPGQFANKEFQDAVDKMINACVKNNKYSIAYCSTVDQARDYLARGFDACIYNMDVIVFIEAYKQAVQKIR